MGESVKAICSLIIIVAAIVALFVWTDDKPDQTTWIVRISTITVAGALGGTIVLSTPATATVLLPTDAAEELPGNSESSTKLIWKLGDPPVVSTANT